MEVVINFLTRPESPVVLPVPAYMPFFDLLRITGRQRVEIPMLQDDSGRYVLDLDALDAAFACGAGSLILCNPNNPLGTAYRDDELRAIVDIAARHHARVIADEIHGPLVYGRPHVAAASVSDTAAHTVVTLMSASKGWNLPGLICAQVVLSNERDARDWELINKLHKMGVSTIGIRANIAAYDHGADWLDELLGYLQANRDHLAASLPASCPGVRVNTPEATYMSWVDFRALNLPVEPADHLLSAAKVALSPGHPVRRHGGLGFRAAELRHHPGDPRPGDRRDRRGATVTACRVCSVRSSPARPRPSASTKMTDIWPSSTSARSPAATPWWCPSSTRSISPTPHRKPWPTW